MKKLDDIAKTNIFEVPEGYFDRLPMRIQAQLEERQVRQPRFAWKLAVRYALPLVIVGFTLVYFLRPKIHQTEELLASVSNENLIAYLDDSEITSNDLLEMANFNETEVDSLNRDLNDTLLGDFDVTEFNGVLENEL